MPSRLLTLTLTAALAGCTSKGGEKKPADDTDNPVPDTDTSETETDTAPQCDEVTLDFEHTEVPADIVFVIDNSGSMIDELKAVGSNINTSFTNVLGQSNLDYQVIMVTRHGPTGVLSGPDYMLCVTPPLSGTTNCQGPAVEVAGQFYHYSWGVDSLEHGALAAEVMGPHDLAAEQWGRHPNGIGPLMRKESVKHFVIITDDDANAHPTNNKWGVLDDGSSNPDPTSPNGLNAAAFDQKLLTTFPDLLGSTTDRRYTWHAIVGLLEKTNPGEAYLPSEPIQGTHCSTATAEATWHQFMAIQTGGLRFPVCAVSSYDTIFKQLAAAIEDDVVQPCVVSVPPTEIPKGFVVEDLEVAYTPKGTGKAQTFGYVASEVDCTGADEFFVTEETDGSLTVELCPATCDTVSSDSKAKLDLSVCL